MNKLALAYLLTARRLISLSLAALVLLTALAFPANAQRRQSSSSKPLLIAHRGASGNAPEHTLAAYRLAIDEGADFVEQDLQMTKDGALICLHDADLARTTNVEEVFPYRAGARDVTGKGNPRRGWYAVDFTLAEIKRLDAGTWFNQANPFAANPAYARERVPTLEEAIKTIGTRAGLYIELKYYPFYKSLGRDMVERLRAALKAAGYDKAGRRERVFVQSFHKECLLKMKEVAPRYARVQLLPMETAGREDDTKKITPELVAEISAYARGAGPAKAMLMSAEDVGLLHGAGLIVHPYTFRGSTLASARRPMDEKLSDGVTVRSIIIREIQHYLTFGIDGGFTDYPALWKEAVAALDQPKKKGVSGRREAID